MLLQKPAEGKPLVYDLDAVMPFPCLLEQYLIQAIQKETTLKKEYHRFVEKKLLHLILQIKKYFFNTFLKRVYLGKVIST